MENVGKLTRPPLPPFTAETAAEKASSQTPDPVSAIAARIESDIKYTVPTLRFSMAAPHS